MGNMWSKLGKFISELTFSPENEVNRLSGVVQSAFQVGQSESQTLEILRLAEDTDPILLGEVRRLSDALHRGQSEEPSLANAFEVNTPNLIVMWTIAIGNGILGRLGIDYRPVKYRILLPLHEEEERKARLARHRECMDSSRLDRQALQHALWRSRFAKFKWGLLPGLPCIRDEVYLTPFERQASDEYMRAHPGSSTII